jgi:hypothetical protein
MPTFSEVCTLRVELLINPTTAVPIQFYMLSLSET